MAFQFFNQNDPDEKIIRIPAACQRTVKWLPQIGEIFPDFTIATTQGEIRFWDWAPGNWVHLFSHPAAYTPVCTTELASIAPTSRPGTTTASSTWPSPDRRSKSKGHGMTRSRNSSTCQSSIRAATIPTSG